jgi:hypothetical protein
MGISISAGEVLVLPFDIWLPLNRTWIGFVLRGKVNLSLCLCIIIYFSFIDMGYLTKQRFHKMNLLSLDI